MTMAQLRGGGGRRLCNALSIAILAFAWAINVAGQSGEDGQDLVCEVAVSFAALSGDNSEILELTDEDQDSIVAALEADTAESEPMIIGTLFTVGITGAFTLSSAGVSRRLVLVLLVLLLAGDDKKGLGIAWPVFSKPRHKMGGEGRETRASAREICLVCPLRSNAFRV